MHWNMNTRLQLEEKCSNCCFNILTSYDVVFLVFLNNIFMHVLLSDCASHYGQIRRADISTPWWWHSRSSKTSMRLCIYHVRSWVQVRLVGWNEFCIIHGMRWNTKIVKFRFYVLFYNTVSNSFRAELNGKVSGKL